jgi:hypothetical protein
MYHITVEGACEPLLDMAQKLDMTPDEIESYRLKLADMHELSETLAKQQTAQQTAYSSG